MMKKSLLAVALLLLIIAALPMVGNVYLQNQLKDIVKHSKNYGLELQKQQTKSSYLTTQHHYTFVVKDAKKLLEKLATTQDIIHTDATLLNKTLLGVDISYNNLLFARVLKADIYPLALNPELMNALEKKDKPFAVKIKEFFANKGILYHIEYNLLNEKFKGSIKDIQQEYTLKDKTEISFVLQGASFKGKGSVLGATELQNSVKSARISLQQKDISFAMMVEKLHSSNDFVSWSNYTSKLSCKHLRFDIQERMKEHLIVDIEDLRSDADAKEKNKKVILRGATSLKKLLFDSKDINISLQKVDSEVVLYDVDPQSYEQFATLVTHNAQLSKMMQEKLEKNLEEMFAKGLQIQIKKLGFQELVLDGKNLNSLNLFADIKIKPDTTLSNKLQTAPLSAVQNIALQSTIELSEALYKLLTSSIPNANAINNYAKMENGKVIFDVRFTNTQLMINNKVLQ